MEMPAPQCQDDHKYEIFKTLWGESLLIFIGHWGDRGVLRWHGEDGWTYFASGSLEWDSDHQEVYRNHRASPLTAQDLEKRGIPLPDIAAYHRDARSVSWTENFNANMPLEKVPPGKLAAFRARPAPGEVYLVLFEDVYESSFGDGRYLYPKAAFWDEAHARDYLSRKEAEESARPKNECGYFYTLKAVPVRIDEDLKLLAAQLNVAAYEHYSLADIVELLA